MMRLPRATYRLQFRPGFGFKEAERILAYLDALGISDIYASPIFRARLGSEHGYDVVDPTRINPELGTEEEFGGLLQHVRKAGMGWLQDIVPNHMAFDAGNLYLADIFESGPASRYFSYFDIDWNHYYESIRGQLLVPFLGSFYGKALEAGELRLLFNGEGFAVLYYDLRFPLRIESYLEILSGGVVELRRKLGEDHPDYIQLLGVLYVLKTLDTAEGSAERCDQVRFVKQTLSVLHKQNPSIRKVIEGTLRTYNGRAGTPESFNPMESLLGQQWFRLAYWKVATEEINYRRFFSINDLISLKMDREVFDGTHALALRLLKEGGVTGLRVDHIDGLYDPAGYLARLREEAPETYLVVEKILEGEEALPPWPVQGTTGYDFLGRVNAIFCQGSKEKALSRGYARFTGRRESYRELVYAKKKLIIEKHMFGDVNNLAHLLKNIASRHRYGSDITMDSLKRALIEIMALFPVYRTYLGPEGAQEEARPYIVEAVESSRELNPGLINEVDYIGRILLLEFDDSVLEEERGQWLNFAMRFQQFTGPLMAKGVEDTVFYIYNRLLSLNEVGGSPEAFGLSVESFHAFNRHRREKWPCSMNATSTHDTKRGEDLRARLNVLSEIPEEWIRHIRSWSRLNRGMKKTLRRRLVPDRNDEYFFYETLLGAFPFGGRRDFHSRLQLYLIKAVREAKVHTAWLKPDMAYEEAFAAFVEGVLDPSRDNPFWKEFLPFQRRVAHHGMMNSLAQTLLKIASPGIPDFYQGSELWELSLVDPDNRRPVDFDSRSRELELLMERREKAPLLLIKELLGRAKDGRVKLFTIHAALSVRRLKAELFQVGDYLPLEVTGSSKEHLVAFARRHEGLWAIAVVPRLTASLVAPGRFPIGNKVWKDTCLKLPESCGDILKDIFTGRSLVGNRLPVGDILKHFPLALLTNF